MIKGMYTLWLDGKYIGDILNRHGLCGRLAGFILSHKGTVLVTETTGSEPLLTAIDGKIEEISAKTPEFVPVTSLLRLYEADSSIADNFQEFVSADDGRLIEKDILQKYNEALKIEAEEKAEKGDRQAKN